MTIGQKIKELRIQNGLTQEKVADYLCLSYQAVSKWETEAACPDLSMIGPLTKLFHVSADELLCLDGKDDAHYLELQQSWEQTFHTGDLAMQHRICETAVHEYPGDMSWHSRLAWIVFNRSGEYGCEKQQQEIERSIKLFEAVIKDSEDEALQSEAIEGMTRCLGFLGRFDEAKEYASLLPERRGMVRSQVWLNCLSEEEEIAYRQQVLMDQLEGVIETLGEMGDYSDQIEKLIRTMFADGSCGVFDLYLYMANLRALETEMGGDVPDLDRVSVLLKKAVEAAKRYDRCAFDEQGIYRYSVPWFDRLETDSRRWIGNQSEPLCEQLRRLIAEKRYAAMRADPRFGESLAEL